jgi:zinc transporter ZupT
MDEIFNERVRSTSAWMNQLATAVVVAGGLTPAAGLYYGLYSLRADGSTVSAIAYACTAGAMLHLTARDMLGLLRI